MLLKYWAGRCRHLADNAKVRHPQHFFGIVAMSYTDQGNFLENLIAACGDGTNEIMCHPAADDGTYDFMEGYDIHRRQRELDLLVSEQTRKQVADRHLQLISYRDL